ncbi:serine hydrolase domain-containing protein [Geodermatophilus sp. SYSU D00700]
MTALDELRLETRVAEVRGRQPCVGLAVGVVRNGALDSFSAHGLADIPSRTPVTEDTVFRIGSITKTVTAIAVMQLVEQGRVDLDAPANDHLRAYRLVPRRPDWRPATVRHLLTHTAGIAEEVPRSAAVRRQYGIGFPPGRVPTPAEYYRGRVRLDVEPGTRFRYTDHGPTAVGQVVEDVSGLPFDRYVRERVFAPLGMTDSDLVLTDRLRPRVATGYRLSPAGPRPVPRRDAVTAPAGNVYSTPRDMARYLAALTGGGANAHGRVLQPATLDTVFEPHYRPDPRIPGMGLAFWRVDGRGHRVVEHQGTMPGFDAQVFVAPDDGVGVMAFTNGTHQGPFWLPGEIGGLLEDLLGIPHREPRTDVPQHPEVWGELVGRYRVPGPVTDVRATAFLGAGLEVSVRRGRLWVRFLTPVPTLARGFELRPDDEADPYAFRLDLGLPGTGGIRAVFGRDPAGRTTGLALEMQPVWAERRTGAVSSRRWAEVALAAAGAAVLTRSVTRARPGRRAA